MDSNGRKALSKIPQQTKCDSANPLESQQPLPNKKKKKKKNLHPQKTCPRIFNFEGAAFSKNAIIASPPGVLGDKVNSTFSSWQRGPRLKAERSSHSSPAELKLILWLYFQLRSLPSSDWI